jgi:hypothetical protein
MDKRPCYKDPKDTVEDENIPAWCPLPYAKPPQVPCKNYSKNKMCCYNDLGRPAAYCQESGPCIISIRGNMTTCRKNE